MFMSSIIKRLVTPAFFYVCFLAACSDVKQSRQIAFSGPTMGTSYSVKVVSDDFGHSAEQLQALVDDELLAINQSFSTYIPDSELSLFNQYDGEDEISISASLCFLVELNNNISEATGGRYDATVGPLVNLWGFGPEERYGIPSQEALSAAKAKVGYQSLKYDCGRKVISKTKPVYLDLSASAKGYATDKIAELLQAQGYKRAMIEIGGELRLLGTNAKGQAWRIAVEKPSLGRTGSVQVLQVSDVAVATSGDYRNYYELDGKRISHTIDPITASPITHKLASVTVIESDGARADAWATAFNVLGPDLGYDLAKDLGIAAYFLVSADGSFEVRYTPSFEKYMVNL